MNGYVTVSSPMHHDIALLPHPELFSKSANVDDADRCGDK